MDAAELLAKLTGEADPYRIPRSAVESFNYIPQRRGDELTSLGVGFAKALAQGYMDGQSRNFANTQASTLSELLPELTKNPLKVQRPAALDERVFNEFRTRSLQNQLLREQAQEDETRAIKNAAITGALSSAVTDPRIGKKILADMFQGELNPTTAIAQPTEAVALERPASVTGALPAQQAGDPQQAIYDIMDSQGLDFNTARAEAIRQQELGEQNRRRTEDQRISNVDRERAMRKDFLNDPITREYLYAEEGLGALVKAVADPRPIADVEIVRRGIQAIEPGLAVRLDDAQAIERSTSLPDWAKQTMLSALGGESRMTPEQRQGILDIAKRARFEKAKSYNAYRDSTLDTIKQYGDIGLDPERVLTYPRANIEEAEALGGEIPIISIRGQNIAQTPENKAKALALLEKMNQTKQNLKRYGFGS